MLENLGAYRAGSPGQALLHHGRHRLPGHCPGRADPALRPRGRDHGPGAPGSPGRRRRQAGARGDQERLLRPPARRVGRWFRSRGGATRPRRCWRRGPRRARARRRGPGSAGGRRRGHPFCGHGLVRRTADPGGRDQPAGPLARCGRHRGGQIRGPHDRGVDRLRGQYAPGRGQGGAAQREPIHARRPLGGRGVVGAPSAGRPAGRVAQARQVARIHQEGAVRDRCRRRTSDRGQGREGAGGMGERRARAGRHGPGTVARVARRLPVHEGARRAGARRAVGRAGADHDRAAVDHRVRAGGAAARLDPGLPDGGADHRVVRREGCCASSPASPRASST